MKKYHYGILIVMLLAAYFVGVVYASPGAMVIAKVKSWTGSGQ
jgi:hypothetical protein